MVKKVFELHLRIILSFRLIIFINFFLQIEFIMNRLLSFGNEDGKLLYWELGINHITFEHSCHHLINYRYENEYARVVVVTKWVLMNIRYKSINSMFNVQWVCYVMNYGLWAMMHAYPEICSRFNCEWNDPRIHFHHNLPTMPWCFASFRFLHFGWI